MVSRYHCICEAKLNSISLIINSLFRLLSSVPKRVWYICVPLVFISWKSFQKQANLSKYRTYSIIWFRISLGHSVGYVSLTVSLFSGLQNIGHFLRLSKRAHFLFKHWSSNVFFFVWGLLIIKKYLIILILQMSPVYRFSVYPLPSLSGQWKITQFANKSYQHASLLGYLS